MNEQQIKELNDLFSDEAFVQSLAESETTEDNGGELSENQLEKIAGGLPRPLPPQYP